MDTKTNNKRKNKTKQILNKYLFPMLASKKKYKI